MSRNVDLQTILLPLLIICNCMNLRSQELPSTSSLLFAGSGVCAQCHIPGTDVFTTEAGTDISPTNLWRSTMMANATRDPLWQAKVTTEVSEHPDLQSIIEDKCTTCHTPMGRTEALYQGADYYSFSESTSSSLSEDGISCTLCHQILSDNLGTDASFSGGYAIENIAEIYGPYQYPAAQPMINVSGYTPVFSDHVNGSELCATCHTLFTPYVDNDGQVAGYFPEQTPYLEWKNSNYPASNTDCQSCHMPAVNQKMKISTRPPMLSNLRSPIWKHDFAGGNIFMVSLIKNNSDEINVTASPEHFDTTISKTKNMLQEKAINLDASANIINDSLNVEITVENLCGHKFPTGFPSRRAWLETMVIDEQSDTIFHSGKWDETGKIQGLNYRLEPHHNYIKSDERVQIYQSVMQDVNGDITYTLLRGSQYAKDNRLPPKGFQSSEENYNSIAVIGEANQDLDFNKAINGKEGTGVDKVHYQMPINSQSAKFTIEVSLWYQSISPAFAENLFQHSSPQVTSFKRFYDNENNLPVPIKTKNLTINSNAINYRKKHPGKFEVLKNYPNPFNSSTTIRFILNRKSMVKIKIYDLTGMEIETLANSFMQKGQHEIHYSPDNLAAGIYICKLLYNNQSEIEKLMLLK